MKFIYTQGPYIEYRGYVFCNGKPAEVTDEATIRILRGRVDFKELREADEVPAQQAIRRQTLKVRR